jgi:BirA family transcriptional regulator, biotin operon repressor / biotin---[acetyl-CoA-carboxylase] ligase
MPLRSDILKELEANRDKYLSGQYLAEKFGVSRNAVWKTINILKTDSYDILSVSNKGYRLADRCDLLSAEGIHSSLTGKYKDLSVFSYKEVDSTNNEAKRLIASGFDRAALITAESQTAGRGRYGRTFYSPEQTGIYMTMVIHPKIDIYNAVSITTAASVAVVRAIETLTNAKPQIKWVNDIYLDNKKLCGILTEAVTGFESGITQSIIIGIGININTVNFPADIAGIAVSLNPDGITRNKLTAEIAKNILDISENLSDKSYLDEYRAHSLVLEKYITYYKNGDAYNAKAVAVDDAGGLVVMDDNGLTEVLRSGEISIRLKTET